MITYLIYKQKHHKKIMEIKEQNSTKKLTPRIRLRYDLVTGENEKLLVEEIKDFG